MSVNAGFFVAGGTDSSGYISAAERWRTGEIVKPAPLHLWATWPQALDAASPVGYRPGLTRGTDISVYPLGFPVFIAAAVAAGGALAAHLVAPAAAMLLTWCTFALGRLLAGSAAGLVGALLIAVTPVTLLHTVDAMSDVPAAAFWALGWLLSFRGTRSAALAAGAAVSAAILVRPNLAPLALVPGTLILVSPSTALSHARQWQWRHALSFAAVAAIGPAVVAWSQTVLYGGPLVPGYVEWQGFFRAAHIAPNIEMYPRLLMHLHTPLVFAGLAGVLLVRRRGDVAVDRRAGALALSAAAVLVVNAAVYLPYLSLDDWPFLRFLLPGLVALFILFAAVIVRLADWLAARSRWLVPLAAIPVAIVIAQGAPQIRYSLNEWRAQTRVRLMGHYLRDVLPPNAAVMSFVHSGAVRHYTGRQIVRLDLLDPTSLDHVADDLRAHGYHPVFVLDEALEAEAFRARFPQSRYGRLDWPPRATFTTVTRILFLDPADREAFRRGQRWVTDELK